MKRPLLTAVLFFLLGIFAGRLIQSQLGIVLFSGLAFFSALALARYHRLPKLVLWAAFFCFMAVLGFCRFRQIHTPPPMPERVSDRGLIVDRQHTADPELKKLTIKMADTTLYTYGPNTFEPGDVIHITGNLSALSPARNPGGFHERNFYYARGIYYRVDNSQLTKQYTMKHSAAFFYKQQNRLAEVYDRLLPEKEAGIIKSIVLGDRSGLDPETRSLYGDAGIYHILAISGLHISILAMALSFLTEGLLGRKYASLFTFILLSLYCIFTGASPSTVRAVILFGFLAAGKILFREPDGLTSLAAAAFGILLYNPFYLWDLGFQFSFSAVAGMVLLDVPLNKAFRFFAAALPVTKGFFENPWVQKSLQSSTAVFLATLPVGTAYAPYLLPYSILVNLILFPTFTLLVVAGMLAGAAGFFSHAIATFLIGSVYYLLKLYENIGLFFTGLPGAKLLTGQWPVGLCLLYYLTLAAGAGYLTVAQAEKKKKRAGYGLASSASALLVYAVLHFTLPEGLSMTMLDVGQGDCTVLTDGAFTMVIDGGGYLNRELGQNTGVKVLMPYLAARGIGKVDVVLLTHLDWDHSAGILELALDYPIGLMLLPKVLEPDHEVFLTLLEIAAEKGFDLQLSQKGDVYKFNELFVHCLYPNETTVMEDNVSLVARIERAGFAFLSTGDMGGTAEKHLLDAGDKVNAQVLKVAHHGSRFSSTEAFLDAIQPVIGLAGMGRNNRYGFPAAETVQKLKDRGISFYTTANHGAITLRPDFKTGRIAVEVMIDER